MIRSDLIGLELAPTIIRGVRVRGNSRSKVVRTIEVTVEKDHEAEALRQAIARLGGRRTSLRIVLRGVSLSTTRLLREPPEKIKSISEHIPIPMRQATWEAIPLAGGRTMLLGADRSKLEEALDRWGITPTSGITPDAVGLTTAALIALEAELPGSGDVLWVDSERHLRLVRGTLSGTPSTDPAVITDVRMKNTLEAAAVFTGPGAGKALEAFPSAMVYRPATLDPAFAVAVGATRWGSTVFPGIPNLEPLDRREFRQKRLKARSQQRLAVGAAMMLLALSVASFGAAFVAKQRAGNALEIAKSHKVAAENALAGGVTALTKRIPVGTDPARFILRVLDTASSLPDTCYIAELRFTQAAKPYANLQNNPAPGELIVSGRTRTLPDVENLRTALTKAGYEATIEQSSQTARQEYPVDFRMVVR